MRLKENLLKDIARQIGYDQAAFKHIFDMVLNQSYFANGQASSATALNDAYKAL